MSDTLLQYFIQNQGRLINKWMHYFAIYERHFEKFKGKPVRLLEYGVSHGGSLQMWRHYFGPTAQIIGVDIDPRCAAFAEPGIDVFIGDQQDPKTHQHLRDKYGEFDIVVDDGGHTMQQQIVTFREMYAAVKAGGIYLAEDLHTSYLPKWGGGVDKPDTFIAYSKALVDLLHTWYTGPVENAGPITRSTYGIHYYDSVLVIEKMDLKPPVDLMSGHPSFPLDAREYQMLADHWERLGEYENAIHLSKAAQESDPAAGLAIALLAKGPA